MRHQIAGKKLSRSTGARKALFKSLLTELFRHERIETTEAKAKAIRAQAEKLISIARQGDYVVCLGAGNITQWAAALPGELATLQAAQTRRAG